MTEFKANLDQARAEGYEEATKANELRVREKCASASTAALSEGKRMGRTEALKDLDDIRCETFYRAVYFSFEMPSWAPNVGDRLEADGTANEKHPYWWGRALAHMPKTHGL